MHVAYFVRTVCTVLTKYEAKVKMAICYYLCIHLGRRFYMFLYNGHSRYHCKTPYMCVDMCHSNYQYNHQSNRLNSL